ncbi:hypothetical protein K488DRAFT_88613 [Vararia minispora EC-137]|uniref:Uncharacterized protein n=1 Tax=Vararia minispora EC-137 TaxID=1314806 RepID=A0ACB8QCL8_9AGAM|nr:hypothetical protein K488DRAFT_88613 [Vararia minispora EC-137]
MNNSSLAGPSNHKRSHGRSRGENRPPRQFLAPVAPTSEDDASSMRKKRSTIIGRVRSPLDFANAVLDVPMSLKSHPPMQSLSRTPKWRPSNPISAMSVDRPLPELPSGSKPKSKKEKEPAAGGGGKKIQAERRLSEAITVSDDEEESDSLSTLSGTQAPVEITRLRTQISELKKLMSAKERVMEEQAKSAVKLKKDLQAANKEVKSQRAELDKLHAQSKQSKEIISNIENTLQCQICIDTLCKPFALSPCGHVLCQDCLQNWFRRAPIDPDDMDTDDDALPLVQRKKTCPVCRTLVRARPLPLFVLKSLLSTLEKARDVGARRPSPPLELEDPWRGIFLETGETSSEDGEDDDDGSADDDSGGENDEDDSSIGEDDAGLLDAYDNTSDDEYTGEWNLPGWEPPAWRHSHTLHPEPLLDKLLRRGATVAMIEAFGMDYSHVDGLIAVDQGMTLYLGYNIELADDDEDGSRFIEWCWEDLDARPERWIVNEEERTVTRMIREDKIDEFDETDSEYFIGDSDEE